MRANSTSNFTKTCKYSIYVEPTLINAFEYEMF
jgi:hypothetical protein